MIAYGWGGHMATYPCQLNLLQRSVLVVDWDAFDSVECVVSVDDLAKDSVATIKVGLLGVCDEELRLVRVTPRISHCDYPSGIKLVN